MRNYSWIAAIALCFGLNAFADAPRGFVQTAKPAVRAAEPRDTADFPQGYYVNEDGDLSLRITKSAMLRTEFGLQLTNGTKAPFDFPRKLRYLKSDDLYKTTGDVSVSWWTTVGLLTCRYPVSVEIEDLGNGDTIRAHFTMPQTMSIDAYARCISYGTTHKTLKFNRE